MPSDSTCEIYNVDKKGKDINMAKGEEEKDEKQEEDEDEGYLNMGHTDVFSFL